MLSLLLIRHAQSRAQLSPQIISGGDNTPPLTDLGHYQSQLLEERLKKEEGLFDAAYSSQALRTWQTAQHVLPAAILENIKITPLLGEIFQGAWIGEKRVDTYTSEILAQINADLWHFKAPGGESPCEVEGRMLRFLEEVVKNHRPSDRIIAFTHAYATKCLLKNLLHISPKEAYELDITNTAITEIVYGPPLWKVIRIGDCSHLKNVPMKENIERVYCT